MDDARLLITGRWTESSVIVTTVASTRRLVPAVEAAIAKAWDAATARPGVRLFDGPVCRLESFAERNGGLHLALSQTSYRVNVGTNFFNPRFASVYGPDVMANPLGVSAALISSDRFLMLGRRNATVVYYPHLLHPFAGSAEVRASINLFDDVGRELREELGFGPSDVASIECIGIGEDAALAHPEMLFLVRSTRMRDAIQAGVDPEEHGSSEAFACNRATLDAVCERADVTPIGRCIARRVRDLIDVL